MTAGGSVDSWTAELLLLSCLSAGREPSAVSRQPTSGWSEVVKLAESHGLGPLLYRRLKESEAQAPVPTDSWERLRLLYFVNAERNTCLYLELRPVLQCLRDAGIPVIVLKGAYLAEAVYSDAALRCMWDADLMVPRVELAKAQTILLDMGGVHQQLEDIESCCEKGPHLPVVVIRGLSVEIHWTIVIPNGPFRADGAGLWDRARPAKIAGVEVLALSPEDTLLHLCLHFSHKHHLAGLRSLCDITEVIERFRGEMDWTQAAERACKWGAARHVGLTLHLARSMLSAGVPDEALEQFVPGGVDQCILEAASESVFDLALGYGQWMSFFDLLGAESVVDKAMLSWRRIFLSRDEMAAKYPAAHGSKHFHLYYLLRLRDVIRVYWSHAVKRGRLMLRSRGRDPSAALRKWLKED